MCQIPILTSSHLWVLETTFIGFTLLYFKMAVIPLVPEKKKKMADIGKLISLGNQLVRKVTWFLLTTMSTTLIFVPCIWSRPHDKDCLYILVFQELIILHFDLQRQNTLSLSSFQFPETAWPCHLVIQFNTRNMSAYTFCHLFLSCSAFSVRFFQPQTQPQKFHQTPKETNHQHGRRHVPPKIHCCIFVYRYLA